MLLSDLLALIKKNDDIEFKYIPCCPRHADAVCASMTGKCVDGNKKDCHQQLMFYRNKSPFFIDVTFVFEIGGKDGFVNETDLSIKNLKARKII